MTQPTQPLAPFLAEPSRIGQEISVTGKWVPTKPGGLFRTSAESKDMLNEWEDIHGGARADDGVLSTEINHAVGEDAVLVHHVFEDPTALVHYFATTATQHMAALTAVAKPAIHLVRGTHIPDAVKEAVTAKGVPATFGELYPSKSWSYGFYCIYKMFRICSIHFNIKHIDVCKNFK